MTQLLASKSILITGGGSGIGRAAATVCAEQGARPLVADLHLAGAEETAAHIRDQGGPGQIAEKAPVAAVDTGSHLHTDRTRHCGLDNGSSTENHAAPTVD